MTNAQLADLRQTYSQQTLSEADVLPDAIAQFQAWLDEALAARLDEPTAMTLSTVNMATGQPSSRVVLLKGLPNAAGFLFYTNYESQKGRELAGDARAALNFFWPGLERQVRVQGQVQKASADMSTAYFQSRPRASQVGAWASPQSQPVPDRAALEAREQAVEAEFAGQQPLPRPSHWGGFILLPSRVEFWQGRPSRLHDRILYEQAGPSWKISRLAP